jgi:hypothetical protein
MEMWLRLATHGSVGMLKNYQAVYRRHATNMSLAYTADSFLPDIRQRKAAVDSFLETCGHALPNMQKLERQLYWLLARDAVGLGSSAFNSGKMQNSQELCDFALRICPSIRWSFAWVKIACKRRIGHKAWRVLQSSARPSGRMGSLLSHSERPAKGAGEQGTCRDDNGEF